MPAVFVSGLFSSSKVNALAVSLQWIPWCVVLGHNDRHDRLATPLKWYHLTWSLLLLIAATRLSADFVPKVRTSHRGYAAALWVIVILFWAWKITKDASPTIPRSSAQAAHDAQRSNHGPRPSDVPACRA